MDAELKCPACTNYYANPVLLPCNHSICKGCALSLQVNTDCNPANSFPNLLHLSPLHDSHVTIACPQCSKVNYLGQEGVTKLKPNRLLETIVYKQQESKKSNRTCQICPDEKPEPAKCMCLDCEVFFCAKCSDKCHPLHGPLSGHILVSPEEGGAILLESNKTEDATCSSHDDHYCVWFCNACKVPICSACREDGHVHHTVIALKDACKTRKALLTNTLQSLDEKATVNTNFRQSLETMTDQVHTNSQACKDMVETQCQALIEAVERKRAELFSFIDSDCEQKVGILGEQAAKNTTQVQRAIGLIQYSVEALKEQDNLAFFKASTDIINRVTIAEKQFNKADLKPRISPFCGFTLDNRSALHEIDSMHFLQTKPPGPPAFVPEECSSDNNDVTLVWQPPHSDSLVEGYILELDDGLGGDYREVYCGPGTTCHVNGLHFDSKYTARVKCYNQQQESQYGKEYIRIQTSKVATFNFDSKSAHKDMLLSEDGVTVTCKKLEERVALGSIGFSRGVHYWEYRVDRYENHPDPAFGVARLETARDLRLGKDQLGWSMFVDKQRSWLLHGGDYIERCDRGISKGSTVGVKLDLNKKTLSYYINGCPHGPAFTDMHGGVFFPAVSVNRNVQVTLRTGLQAPDGDDK